MRIACFKVALLGLVLGCASTTVVKNPGPNTNGLRYNLPKPYLLITQATRLEGDKDNQKKVYVPNMVSIALEMRPDYSEEYAIQVKTGVGYNKTTLTLEDGWKLVKVDTKVDSKTNENVSALADALSAIPKLGKSGGAPAGKLDDGPVSIGEALGVNIPLGYYESVIGPDPNGKKRLYGWRYVGFMPFNPCPTVGCGVAAGDCRTGEVYGLVVVKGVMTFKRLDQIAAEDAGNPVK